MAQNTASGTKDVKSTPAVPGTGLISKAAQEIAMLLALQRKEWQELRSTPGIVLNYINLKEPTSGRTVLLVAIGTKEDDIIGNDATLEVSINGVGIDAIVEQVVKVA